MEGVKINRLLHKSVIVFIKIMPMLIALAYFVGTILSLFAIDAAWLSYISGMSLIPLLFMYLCSYVFKFCGYHRMFLHYITFNMIINCLDWYFILPISNRVYFTLFIAITCIFLFVILYLYLKSRSNEKNSNTNT